MTCLSSLNRWSRRASLLGLVGTLLAAGCGGEGDPEVFLDGGTDGSVEPMNAILKIDPTSKDFGSVAIGQMSAATNFVVSNTGNGSTAALAVSSTSMDFVLSGDCVGKVLAPTNTCTVSVVFKPTAAGVRSGAVNVTAGSITQTISLMGTGGSGVLTVTPTPVDFGTLAVGATSAEEKTVRVTNTSAVAVTGLSVTVTGATADYIVTNGCMANMLAANGTCDVKLKFKPASGGRKDVTITAIYSGGAESGTVTGVGQVPAGLLVEPTMVDLVAEISKNVSTPIQVTNIGDVPTGTLTATISGADMAQFTATTGCNRALAPNAMCTLSVVFAPTGMPGMRTATLTIAGTPGGMKTVALKGTANGPVALTIAPNGKGFGSVEVGKQSEPEVFTITNTGGVASGTVLVNVANAANFTLVSTTCGPSLAPTTGSCLATVRFTPSQVGANLQTSLVVTTNPGGATSVNLTGTGTAAPALSIAPTTGNYGAVGLGSTTPITFRVTNTGGTATSAALSASVTGVQANQFAKGVDNCTQVLQAGEYCDVVVNFVPSIATPAEKGATLLVTAGTLSASANLSGAVTNSALTASVGTIAGGNAALNIAKTLTPVTITNTGMMPSGMVMASITGLNAADFEIDTGASTCGASLAPITGTCTVVVKLNPKTTGAKTATLSVTSAAAGGVAVSLTGTGRNPIEVTPAGPFADTQAGFTSAAVDYTVTSYVASTGNLGTALAAGNPPQFVVLVGTDTCNGNTLGFEGTCVVPIRFTPQGTTVGARTGTLTVTPSGAGLAPVVTNLTANVAAPVKFTITSDDFGAVQLNTSLSRTYTVTNSSQAAVTLNATVFTPGSAEFTKTADTCTGATLSAVGGGTDTCTVTLQLLPTSVGPKTASVTVSSTTPASTSTLTVVGAGVQTGALISAAPSPYAFPTAVAPASTAGGTQVFTFSNMGDPALLTANWGPLAPATVSTTDFTISMDTCSGATVIGGNSCTVTVKFTPTGATGPGPKNAILSVAPVANPANRVDVALTATASAAVSIDTPAWDFGIVSVGDTALNAKTIRVTNNADTVFTITGSAVAGGQAAELPVTTNGCTGTIAAGGFCDVVITPAATTAGVKATTYTLTGTLGGAAYAVASALTATAVAEANLEFDVSTIYLGSRLPTGSTFATGGRDTAFVNVRLANIGGATSGPLSDFTAAAAIGGANANYVIAAGDSDPCAPGQTLAAGESCNIKITFTAANDPLANYPSARNVTLTVAEASGSATLDSETLAINAWATAPTSSLVAEVGAGLAAPPAVLSTYQGATDATRDVVLTFRNPTSSGSIVGTAIAFAGPDMGAFSVVADTCPAATVAFPASSNCQVTVRIDTTTAGTYRTELLYGDADNVTGGTQTALSVPIVAKVLANAAATLDTTTAVAFGNAVIGVVPAVNASTVRVTNTGNAATSAAPTAALTTGTDFAVTGNTCTAALAPTESCVFTVTFTPTAAGARADTLTVTAGAASDTTALTGTGLTAATLVAAGSPTFTAQATGHAVTQAAAITLSLPNNSQASGPIRIAVSDARYTVALNACTGGSTLTSILQNTQCTFDVTFLPTAPGVYPATVTFSAAPGGTQTVTLAGTATQQLTANAGMGVITSFAFPNTVAGPTAMSAATVFTITNAGDAAVTLASLGADFGAITGTNASEFDITANTCVAGAYAAGANTCTITVTFNPRSVGAKAAVLTVNGGTPATSLALPITGTATAM